MNPPHISAAFAARAVSVQHTPHLLKCDLAKRFRSSWEHDTRGVPIRAVRIKLHGIMVIVIQPMRIFIICRFFFKGWWLSLNMGIQSILRTWHVYKVVIWWDIYKMYNGNKLDTKTKRENMGYWFWCWWDMYIYNRVYIYIYVCMYVFMYIYMYVNICM